MTEEVLFDGFLIEAIKREVYEEFRTREVEEGRVRLWELSGPYPYRRHLGFEGVVVGRHRDGSVVRWDGDWRLTLKRQEDGNELLEVVVLDFEPNVRVRVREGSANETGRGFFRIFDYDEPERRSKRHSMRHAAPPLDSG